MNQQTNCLLNYVLKFVDLVDSYTAQIKYKVCNNLLPNCIPRLFKIRESQCNLRGMYMF